MKPTAFFITTARGPVHDEDALHDALVSGTIAGAGIDVFHDEPPDPSHPLLSLDNVVASPHTAGITIEATRDIAVATAEQWITIFAGKVPPRLLNPEAWPAYSDRFHDPLGVSDPRSLCSDESVPHQERQGARAAGSSGDRRRRPLGRAVPDVLRLHRRGRQRGRRRQVPLPLRPPVPRLVRAHRRGAAAAAPAPPVVLGRADQRARPRRHRAARASSTTASTTGASTSPSCSRASGSRWAATSPIPS